MDAAVSADDGGRDHAPGPDDLRWAEDMFAAWERRFAGIDDAGITRAATGNAGPAGDVERTDPARG